MEDWDSDALLGPCSWAKLIGDPDFVIKKYHQEKNVASIFAEVEELDDGKSFANDKGFALSLERDAALIDFHPGGIEYHKAMAKWKDNIKLDLSESSFMDLPNMRTAVLKSYFENISAVIQASNHGENQVFDEKLVEAFSVENLFPLPESDPWDTIECARPDTWKTLSKEFENFSNSISKLRLLDLRFSNVEKIKSFFDAAIECYMNSTDRKLRSAILSSLVNLSLCRGDLIFLLEVLFLLLRKNDDIVLEKPEIFDTLRKDIENFYKPLKVSALWRHMASKPWKEIKTSGNSSQMILKNGFHGIASDGTYIYLHCNQGIIKVGSGFNGSIQGQEYSSNLGYRANENVRLAFASGQLFAISDRMIWPTVELIDRKTLKSCGMVHLGVDVELGSPSVLSQSKSLFSDGKYLYLIALEKRNKPHKTSISSKTEKQTESKEVEKLAPELEDDKGLDKKEMLSKNEPGNRKEKDKKKKKHKNAHGSSTESSSVSSEHIVLYIYDPQKKFPHGTHQDDDIYQCTPEKAKEINDRIQLADQLWKATGYHFSKSTCILALKSSSDNLNSAARWLLDHGEILRTSSDIPLIRRVELENIEKELTLDAIERSPIIVTGHQIVFMMNAYNSPWSNDDRYCVRSYSIKNGELISELKKTCEHFDFGIASSYDMFNNVIWRLRETSGYELSFYKNIGPAFNGEDESGFVSCTGDYFLYENACSNFSELPRFLFSTLDQCLSVLPLMEPEIDSSMIKRKIAFFEKKDDFLDNALLRSKNDKLNIYEKAFQISALNSAFYLRPFCLQLSAEVLSKLASIMRFLDSKIISSSGEDLEFVYFLMVCMRIFHSHVQGFSKCSEEFVASVLNEIHSLILSIIIEDRYKMIHDQYLNQIRNLATSIILETFDVFYSTPTTALRFLSQLLVLLENTRVQDLLCLIFQTLSQQPRLAANILFHSDSQQMENSLSFIKKVIHIKSSCSNDALVKESTSFLYGLQKSLIYRSRIFSNDQHNPQILSFFERYLVILLEASLEHVLQNSPENENYEETVKSSVLEILFSILPCLNFQPFFQRMKGRSVLLQSLVNLLKAIEKGNRTIAASQNADRDFIKSFLDEKRTEYVIETPHPYPSGQNVLRETVTIPNADAIVLYFDPRSSTKNANDVLYLYEDASLTKLSRQEPLMGNSSDGNSNWPSKGVIVLGQSVTLLFSPRSQPEEGDSSRWGFKCILKGLYLKKLNWLLDVESSLVAIYSNAAMSFIKGDPYSDQEVRLKDIIKMPILNAGLEEYESPVLGTYISPFLQNFVDGVSSQLLDDFRKTDVKFFGKSAIPKALTSQWDRAIRKLAVVLIKHSEWERRIEQEYSLSAYSKNISVYYHIIHQISNLAHSHQNFMMMQVQDLKRWNYAIIDHSIDYLRFRDEFGHPEAVSTLKQFCSFACVAFEERNIERTVSALYEVVLKRRSQSPESENLNYLCYKEVVNSLNDLCEQLLCFKSVFSENEEAETPLLKRSFTEEGLEKIVAQKSSEAHFLRNQGSSLLNVPSLSLQRAISLPEYSPENQALSNDPKKSQFALWINNYQKWKFFQKRSLKSDESIKSESNLNNDMSFQSIMKILKVFIRNTELNDACLSQYNRALSRLNGIQMINEVFELLDFDSVKIYLLGRLSDQLEDEEVEDSVFCGSNLFYRLDCIPSETRADLKSEFKIFLTQRMKLLSKRQDELIRFVSLSDVYALSYSPNEFELLDHQEAPFHVIFDLISESSNFITEGASSLKAQFDSAKWSAFRFFSLSICQWKLNNSEFEPSALHRIFLFQKKIQDSCAILFFKYFNETCKSSNSEETQTCYFIEILLNFMHCLSSCTDITKCHLNSTKFIQHLFKVTELENVFTPKVIISAFRLLRKLISASASTFNLLLDSSKNLTDYFSRRIGSLFLGESFREFSKSVNVGLKNDFSEDKNLYCVIGHYTEKLNRSKWESILNAQMNLFVVEDKLSESAKQLELKKAVELFEQRKTWKSHSKPDSDRISLRSLAGEVSISDDLSFVSTSGFATIVADVKVFKGKWYYEVVITSPGIKQIGWCTEKINPDPRRNGVGDDVFSWAYDGNRLKKWHVASGKYGGPKTWKNGDVVGVLLDMDQRVMSFTLNDNDLGKAFVGFKLSEDESKSENGSYLSPAISFSQGETGKCVFNSKNLKYSIPEGYYPLEADGPIIHRSDPAKRIKKIVHEIFDENGFSVIHKSSYELCSEISKKFAALGGLVTVSQSSCVDRTLLSTEQNPNANSISRNKRNPRFVNGTVNLHIISELIATARKMAASFDFSNEFKDYLYRTLRFLKPEDEFHSKVKALGALCIIGGCIEPLRRGGFVELNRQKVMVVQQSQNTEFTNLALCDNKKENPSFTIGRYSSPVLVTCSEFDVDYADLKLTAETLEELKKFLLVSTENASSDTFYLWWSNEMKWRSMLVFSKLSASNASSSMLSGSFFTSIISIFSENAAKCPLNWKISDIALALQQVRSNAWELKTQVDSFLAATPFRLNNQDLFTKNPGYVEEEQAELSQASYVFGVSPFKEEDENCSSALQENKMLKYWEKNIIPRIQDYVRGSFRDYEMEYFFESLRQPLRVGNQEAAVKIAFTLCGGRLPDTISIPSNDRDWSTLMLEDVSVGQFLFVTESCISSDYWVPPVSDTIHDCGKVVVVNPKTESVLLQFYSENTATIEEWWYHIENLKFAEKMSHEVREQVFESTIEKFVSISKSFCHLIARQAVFSLCAYSSVFLQIHHQDYGIQSMLDLSSLAASDVLNLSAIEKPGTPSYDSSDNLKLLEENITNVLRMLPKDVMQINVMNFVRDLMSSSVAFTLNNLSYRKFSSLFSSSGTNAVCMEILGSSGLLFMFSADSVLEQSTTLTFYSDEACTEVIKSYSGGTSGLQSLTYAFVPSDRCYIKRSDASLGLIKGHFSLFPIHPKLGVLFWFMNMILSYIVEIASDPKMFCCDLCELVLEEFQLISLPVSPFKQIVIQLVSRLMTRILLMSPSESHASQLGGFKNSLDTLKSLHDEMIELLSKEYKSDWHSSYIQQCLNLCVIADTLRPADTRICKEFSFLKDDQEDVEETKDDSKESDSWSCNLCTFINSQIDTVCQICEAPRPVVVAKAPAIVKEGNQKYAKSVFHDMSCIVNIMQYLSQQRNRQENTVVDAFLRLAYDDIKIENSLDRLLIIENLPPVPEENNLDEFYARNLKKLLKSFEEDFRLEFKSLYVAVDKSSEVNYETKGDSVGLQEILYEYKSDFDENGVLYYLGTCGKLNQWENPHDLKLVQVTCSSLQNDSRPPSAIVGRETVRCVTRPLENSWIQIDFDGVEINPTHYTLRHYNSWHHEALRSWRFEASKNGQQWITLREHIVDESLNHKGATKTWEIPLQAEYFSKFRIIQTGLNSNSNYYLACSGFEIYGKAKGPKLTLSPPPRSSNIFGVIQVLFESESKLKELCSLLNDKLTSWNRKYPTKLKVAKLCDLSDQDARKIQYFKSIIFEQTGVLSKKCENACISVYSRYQSLRMEAADASISFMKRIGGISQSEFLEEFAKYASLNTLSAYTLLKKEGFDVQLQRNHFNSFKENLNLISVFENNQSLAFHNQLLSFIEEQIEYCGHSSFADFNFSQLSTDERFVMHYPLILRLEGNISPASLRFWFQFLKRFNLLLADVLPLIDMRRSEFKTVGEMIRLCRHFIFRKVKLDYITKVLDGTSSIASRKPSVTINRLEITEKKALRPADFDFLSDTSFGKAFKQLRDVKSSSLKPKRPVGAEPFLAFEVIVKGEHVVGEAGPYRQFFTDISSEVLDPSCPLFMSCPNKISGLGESRDKFIIRPTSSSSTAMIEIYEFLGVIFGCAIRTGIHLSLDFPSFVWKPLVGDALDISDLENIDVVSAQLLKDIQDVVVEHKEFDSAFEEKFSILLSDQQQIELKENGSEIPVTFSNRLEYVRLHLNARLNESADAIEAIRRGINKIMPIQLLNLLTWKEFEILVSGRPEIDIGLLERHTKYSGVSPDSPHIKYFWEVLEEFNQDQRRKFIKFTWAQERLPSTDEEFVKSHTRLLIKYVSTSNPDSRFPKADTCFFNLELPSYSSKEILKDRLLFAITNTNSMNADENAGNMIEHGDNHHEY